MKRLTEPAGSLETCHTIYLLDTFVPSFVPSLATFVPSLASDAEETT